MVQKTIVFDLDGTLVDTSQDILESLDHCLLTAGLAPAEPRDVDKYVGLGARVMIERAFALQRKDITAEKREQLVGVFLDHYRANIPGKSLPYPGAADALRLFRAQAYRTAVCTNKFESLSRALIEALGLIDSFDAICGADTFDFRKPDPRHLLETIRRVGGNPKSALMVGDSRTDIATAQSAGVPVIAVDFGFSDAPVATLGPDHVISRFSELTPELAESVLARAA